MNGKLPTRAKPARSAGRGPLAVAALLLAVLLILLAVKLLTGEDSADDPSGPATLGEGISPERAPLPQPLERSTDAEPDRPPPTPLPAPRPIGPNQFFGRVIDAATGQPLQAFQLDILPHTGEPVLPRLTAPGRDSRSLPITAPAGVFRIEWSAGRYDLVIRAPTYLPGVVQDVLVPPGEPGPFEVVLEHGPSLVGRVLSDTGMAQSEVAVFLSVTRLIDETAAPEVFVTRTTATGEFRFSPLPPGEYAVTAHEPDNSTDRRAGLFVDKGESRADLYLSPRHQLVVRVADTANRPVADARVELVGGPTFAAAVSSPEGQAILRHVRGGDYTLRIERAGYQLFEESLQLQGASGQSVRWFILDQLPPP
ncbi:MAG: carboxypeptidase regulatory-like domain-containing protein [Planctomycetota bacterium]